MGEVDWINTPEQDLPGISLTPKCMLPPSHWLGYFDAPDDFQAGRIGIVEKYARGFRTHKISGAREECYLVYLKVSSGDEGWWEEPDPSIRYEFGFHGMPRLCCHVKLDEIMDEMLRAEGVHPQNLWSHIVARELNGRRENPDAVNALKYRVNEEFRKLVGTDFWFLQQTKQ